MVGTRSLVIRACLLHMIVLPLVDMAIEVVKDANARDKVISLRPGAFEGTTVLVAIAIHLLPVNAIIQALTPLTVNRHALLVVAPIDPFDASILIFLSDPFFLAIPFVTQQILPLNGPLAMTLGAGLLLLSYFINFISNAVVKFTVSIVS